MTDEDVFLKSLQEATNADAYSQIEEVERFLRWLSFQSFRGGDSTPFLARDAALLLGIARHELDRLRTENAAMREIVQAVTNNYVGLGGYTHDAVLCYDENAGGLECPWCNGAEQRTQGMLTGPFVHDDDCPVTKARELVKGWETTDERKAR